MKTLMIEKDVRISDSIILEKGDRIQILEKDKSLRDELLKIVKDLAETDTILRLKGMEKTCVLWSTKIKIEDEDEINNFIYTILTRTSGLLIIALYTSIDRRYVDVLKQFRSDRVLVWDNLTKDFISNNYINLSK